MSESKTAITVLKGGPSAEREVSLRTGAAVTQALRELGYPVQEVDVHGPDFELPEGTQLAFLCMHGTFGEDGQVQQILEDRGVPYTGCDAQVSRVAFGKEESKEAFRNAGVPTPMGRILRAGDSVDLPIPYVVKPNRQGSSIGVAFVHKPEDAAKALDEAFKFDDEVVAEEFIKGRELTVGILDGRALPVVEIRPKTGFYDYQNKYTAGATEYLCPAPLTMDEKKNVQEAALKAYWALGCQVYARVDVMLDGEGRPWVLEANTIPGMTATSLLPKAAQAAGIGFGVLCEIIAAASLATVRGVKS